LPRGASTLILFFAQGLKHMLAGMILMSAVVGLVATGGALALSHPTWVAIALYPATCSLTLLIMAAIVTHRSSHASQPGSLLRQQA